MYLLLISELLLISLSATIHAFQHVSYRPDYKSHDNLPLSFPFVSVYPISSRTHLNLTNYIQSNAEELDESARNFSGNDRFDLDMALFLGGLAFDVYTEPPKNSSRYERGSSGLNVAFVSPAFTRSLYKGLLEVTPIRATNLPDEDSTAEGLITGGGTDACLLVGIAEGKWKEDIEILEKQQFNEGVLNLQGCAHIGRSSTAWSNIDSNKASINKKKGGSGAYHIKSSWGKGGEAVWESDQPFYLYVQEPSEARIVLTVCDDNVVGEIEAVGSTYKKLVDLFPYAKADDPVKFLKDAVLAKLKRGENISSGGDIAAQEWAGVLPLTSRPRKKDKNSQIAAAVTAGALVAGPAGAAVGGLLASFYEGEVRGSVEVRMRYLPLPIVPLVPKKYKPKGGLPGVDWGRLLELKRVNDGRGTGDIFTDLEMCFFLTHDKTGCTCVCYRSLEKKMIAISFRGTCQPIDLITDASLVQETWVDGENIDAKHVRKVHKGFRTSLNSVSRKLKELVLAAVAPGDDISQYELIVTGHSLGGALSTLFTCDIAEFGIDAGRGLPTMAKSEPWWNALNLFGKEAANLDKTKPPRPRSLKLYNFGSPRVGNAEFVEKFDSFIKDGIIKEAYRIVNGNDVVARLPRTFNTAIFGSVGYEHAAPTVLISIADDKQNIDSEPLLWIEGQSEGFKCPVRDGTVLTSPLARGSLLGDIAASVDSGDNSTDYLNYLSKLTGAVKERMEKFSAADIPSIVGIDKAFVEREAKIIQTIVTGVALSHHMEDQYYMGIGRACGFVALAGEEIQQLGTFKGDIIDLDKELSL